MFRLSQVKFKKGAQLNFPLIIEGKGELLFGMNAHLEKLVNLGVSKGAKLEIGNNSFFESESIILISQNSSLVVGNGFKLGKGARLYVQNKWQIGNNVRIETNCAIAAREPNERGILRIGNGTHIGDYTIIDLVDDVTFGEEVAIGPNCTLYTHDHVYSNSNTASWKGGLKKAAIVIENGAWIGSNVTILPGVTVGAKAVVGAGSVVTKDIEPFCIYGGVPAKFIKKF